MFWLFQKENEDLAKENFLSTLNGRVFITCFCPIDLHSVLKEAKLVIKMKHINETRWLQDYQWNPSKLTDDPALIIELLLINFRWNPSKMSFTFKLLYRFSHYITHIKLYMLTTM